MFLEICLLCMLFDVIRDIFEGVLRLMGIFDIFWVSMKSFFVKRGVREDIVIFDVWNILKEIRESVEEFFYKNKGFFDLKNVKCVSIVVVFLVVWVKVNI